jgi:uncharacterized repeat protein (TIGR03803 family)
MSQRRLFQKRKNVFLAALACAVGGWCFSSFAGVLGQDFYPWTSVEGRDGSFHGLVLSGDVLPAGFVYSHSPEGELERVVRFKRFQTSGTPSRFAGNPEGTLGVGQDGAIYGSAREGGAFGHGVIFKLDPRRATYRVLHHFDDYSFYKGPFVAAQNGDLFAGRNWPNDDILRLSKDGRQTTIPAGGTVMSMVENARNEIIVGVLKDNAIGALVRLNANDELEPLAVVGYLPHALIPLENGGVLCLTMDRIVEVSAAGDVSVIHEFKTPFEGIHPSFLTIAKDGSYVGSTWKGGLEDSGTIFRIVPGGNQFTLVSHLPSPGTRGAGAKWMERFFPLRVAAEAGNHPPMAKDDVIEASSLKSVNGGLPQRVVPVLKNDADADSDPLSIVFVTNPAHGVVAFDFITQTIVYTANSAEVANDEFTYTIVDGSGGTSTGHVFIRTKAKGIYTGIVSSPANPGTGDPGTEAGRLSVRVHGNRTAVARLDLLGETYRFTGHFNEVNRLGVPLVSRPGRGLTMGIQLWLRPNGAGWSVEATIRKNSLPFLATCTIQ